MSAWGSGAEIRAVTQVGSTVLAFHSVIGLTLIHPGAVHTDAHALPLDRLSIVTGALAEALWQRLEPSRWPLPPEAFPPGSVLVGGAVRDALLDRLSPQPDIDLVVSMEAVALCRQLAGIWGGRVVVLDHSRSMARLVLRGWTIDMARQDGPSLEHDLGRRDYSVNAMALPLSPKRPCLIDPHRGRQDARLRLLRALSKSNLLSDPLRLLRGVRLAGELNFEVEAQSWRWIRLLASHLRHAAPERILMELQRLVAEPVPTTALVQLLRSGMLRSWQSPARAPLAGRLDHSLARSKGLRADEIGSALPLARLSLLVSKAGLAELRAGKRLQQRCDRLRRWWDKLPEGKASLGIQETVDGWDEGRQLRLHKELEEDLPAWLLLTPPGMARSWLKRWRDSHDPLFHPSPPLDGHTLQRELGVPPSRRLGELMEALTRDRAYGRIDSAEQALAEARRLWESSGGSPSTKRYD